MWLILKPLPYCYPTLQPLYILRGEAGPGSVLTRTEKVAGCAAQHQSTVCGSVPGRYNSESAVPTVGLELVTRKGKKVSDLVEDSAT